MIRSRSCIATLAVAAGLAAALPAHGGTNRWTPYGPGGGYLSGLSFDAVDPRALYAFSTNVSGAIISGPRAGGPGAGLELWPSSAELYRSRDGGQSWEWCNGGLVGMGVNSFVADPAASGVLYATTAQPLRLLRSTDGGQSWAPRHEWADAFFGYVTALRGPGRGSTLYVEAVALGGGGRLLRSQDGGASWTQVFDRELWRRPVADPRDVRRLYVAAQDTGEWSLMRSDDAGGSWVRLAPVSSYRYTAPVVEAIDPASGDVYARDQNSDQLYVTANGGASWGSVPNLPAADPYVVEYRIDPRDSTRRYLRTMHASGASLEMTSYASGDGGRTWKRLALPDASHGLAAIHPLTGELFFGSIGIDLRSSDAGRTFRPLGQRGILSFGAPTFERGPDPAVLFRGAGDWSVDGGRTWTPRPAAGPQGDTRAVFAVAPQDPATVYSARPEGVYRSTDQGRSWALAGSPAWGSWCAGHDPRRRAATLVVASPQVLLAQNDALARSTDGGRTWSLVLPCMLDPRQADDPFDDVFRSVGEVTVDPRDPSRMWANSLVYDPQPRPPARQTRTLLRSRDGGATWEPFADGQVQVRYAPSDPSRLYLAREDGLFGSTDAGDTFQPVSPLRLGVDFRGLEVDAQNPQVLMLAGAQGVSRSLDGGATWTPANAGLWRFNRIDVERLVAHPRIGNLYYAYPFWGGTFEGTFP